MALVPQSDGTFLDDETGLVYDANGQLVQLSSGEQQKVVSSVVPFISPNQNDSFPDAAVRARGIDPATNQWIPGYGTGDATATANQIRASATASYNANQTAIQSMIEVEHQKAGGFLADLLNPFSANVDPNAWNSKLANQLKMINWTAVIALVIVLAVLATVHQVKEIV